MTDQAEKPPLGLRARFLADTERAREILEAMQRYLGNGADKPKQIPQEWLKELNEINQRFDA